MIKKGFLLFLGIILLTFTVRAAFLDKVPGGVSNDEVDYILNAKTVFLRGSDISQTWNPFSFTTPKSSFPPAEILPLLTFWMIGPLPLSLFTAKLIYVLFATGTVGLLYLITKKLVGDKEALVVGIVGAINPWLIFFGRTAYDTQVALFFFLLALYLLLVLKGWKILFTFPVLFIAFYSYIGTKLIFIPFVVIILLFSWVINRKNLLQYVIVFLLSVVLFGSYTFSILHSPGTRLNELATPQMSSIATTVNVERRLSIHTPLTTVFDNKYVVFGKYALDKYLNSFSPNFLFLHGDEKAQFTVYNHGVFYYIDAFFLLIGLAVLFKKNRRALFLFAGIILIAPIPSVMSTVGTSYAIRSLLLAPFFIIFIGIGIWFVISSYRLIWVPITIVYALLFLNFLNIYLFQNPIYNSESFNFSGRLLSKYLSFQKEPVYIINNNPQTPFKSYLFYTNSLTDKTVDTVAQDYQKKAYQIGNLHFITCSDAKNIPTGNIIIYDKCKSLHSPATALHIVQLGDSGSIYTILNDKTCSMYTLHPYLANITFSDLGVEALFKEEFCKTYIVRYQ